MDLNDFSISDLNHDLQSAPRVSVLRGMRLGKRTPHRLGGEREAGGTSTSDAAQVAGLGRIYLQNPSGPRICADQEGWNELVDLRFLFTYTAGRNPG